jgi:hypothetical protein
MALTSNFTAGLDVLRRVYAAAIGLAPNFDREGISAETTRARFKAYSAYYVGDLDFLAPAKTRGRNRR